ncbi:hypothetical protein ABBQ38_006433 [Trebouxia sp. C0009 RCD-2024]
MITYCKTAWGLHLLLRWSGSAFPRTLIFSGASTAIAAALYATKRPEVDADWRHPYPFQAFAFIVGFTVVFRSQLSYGRYWEGRLQLQSMTARWADFCTEALTMDAGTLSSNPDRDLQALRRSHDFAQTLVHLTSLLHAVALQHIRGDWELANLKQYIVTDPPPPLDAAVTTEGARIGYVHSLLNLFLLRGGTRQRHKYNRAMPFAVVASVSPVEVTALGQMLAGHHRDQTGDAFVGATERVSAVYTWVQQLLQDRLNEGGLTRAAPIGSRIWQVLSEGYLHFEHCRAIADTPFPFPWAQVVLIMLILYALTTPLVVVAFINSTWTGLAVNFLSVQSYWCLNEVARDLEEPFVYDPNDLPLARYQYQFNHRILAAGRTQRPVHDCQTGSHHLPAASEESSPKCVTV